MAIWDFILKLNSTDSESFGLYVETLVGPWDTPAFSFDRVPLPEHDGTIVTADDPEVESKKFVIGATIKAATESALEDAIDNCKYQLSRSDLAIIVGNRDTRQMTGRLEDFVSVPYDGPIVGVHAEITVVCDDPIKRETSNTTVSGSAAVDRALALGTWRSYADITVTSPTSPLVITGKNSSGTTVGTLTIAFPGSPTTVVVSMGNRTITVDGVRHDEDVTAGDFFAFDPRNGDRGSNLPTIRWSSGTGSAVYAKAWL